MKTGFNIKGTIKLVLEREDGSRVEATQKNMVMKWGLDQVALFLAGGTTAGTLFDHLALGEGTTAPTEADTTLEHETQREQATVKSLTGADSNKVEIKVAYALGAVVGHFSEAGLFDALVNGNMFNRSVFPDFPVTVSDTLTVIWIIEVKNV